MADAQNILITGGTDGIGLQLAQTYANKGANVAVTGRRDLADLTDIIPPNIAYIHADQSQPKLAAEQILHGLENLNWRHCDLAILNAGNGKVCNPLEEQKDDLRNTIDVNLAAPILIAHGLAEFLMAADAGKLVFIGSTSHKGAANFASYAASKSGLNGFARSLREEWRGKVNVQILHPGPIDTNMHEKAGFNPGVIRHIFLNPDFVTRTIIRNIDSGKSPISIGFVARVLDFLTLRNWMAG